MSVAVDARDLSILERASLTQSLVQAAEVRRLMSTRELEALGSWHGIRRPSQSMPTDDDWFVWLTLGGRGSGKTRAGAEETIEAVEVLYEQRRELIRWAIVAPTFGDLREIDVEGESGLLACLDRRRIKHEWNRSNGELVSDRWHIQGYSAEKPDRLRGPQFFGAWLDEPGSYRFPKAVWDLLLPSLRLGQRPRVIVTGTPKIQWLVKYLVEQTKLDPLRFRLSHATTWRNAANLPPPLLEILERSYRGTRLGRQELEGELLAEAEGSLWKLDQLDMLRVNEAPDLRKLVVGVDPAGSSGEDSDETGIIGAGSTMGRFPEAYILGDRSGRWAPEVWARKAINLAIEIGASRIVAEANYGGDLVKRNIEAARRPDDPYIGVELIHAKKSKELRAGPVATYYEARRVHHVGTFGELESQMVAWDPGALEEVGRDSPDRVDALVYAVLDLLGGAPVGGNVSSLPGTLSR